MSAKASSRAEQIASHVAGPAPPADPTAKTVALLEAQRGRPRLEGKVCIVTGAGSAQGIGRSTVVVFAQNGAKAVYAVDLKSEDNFAGLRAEVEAAGTGCAFYGVLADCADDAVVKGLCDRAVTEHGRLDVFFANAGTSANGITVASGTSTDFMDVMRINLLSCFLACKYASLAMRVTSPGKPEPSGSIIMTASVAGISSTGSGGTAYGASKAGVINIAKTASWQFGRYNIRVNALAPGFVHTGMSATAFSRFASKGRLPPQSDLCALRRHAHPLEQAYPVLFMASDESSFVTGQVMVVDGGVSASMPVMPGTGLLGAEDRTAVRHEKW